MQMRQNDVIRLEPFSRQQITSFSDPITLAPIQVLLSMDDDLESAEGRARPYVYRRLGAKRTSPTLKHDPKRSFIRRADTRATRGSER